MLQQPRKGLLIKTNYDPYKRRGFYAVMLIEENRLAIQMQSVENISASDNVMGILAVTMAARWAVDNRYGGPVFIGNRTSYSWAMKGAMKSREADMAITKMVYENMGLIADHDLYDRIQLWEGHWPGPSQMMGSLLSR